jgi:hypothetical protein
VASSGGQVRSGRCTPGPNDYDRQIESIKNQITQLDLEAAGAGKTSAAIQELKTAHDDSRCARPANSERRGDDGRSLPPKGREAGSGDKGKIRVKPIRRPNRLGLTPWLQISEISAQRRIGTNDPPPLATTHRPGRVMTESRIPKNLAAGLPCWCINPQGARHV